MLRRSALVLCLLVGHPAWSGPTQRYTCDVIPGPPVRVRVYRIAGHGRVRVGPELRYPRLGKMASAADVDADGRLDLLVLVFKSTRFDRKPGWRPFVYTLGDGRWVPKWLGSRVGRPLVEAALVHTPAGVRLLTIERFGKGRSGLTLYHWRGFGFRGEWTGPAMKSLSNLTVTDRDGDGIDEIEAREQGGARVRLTYAGRGYRPVSIGRKGGDR